MNKRQVLASLNNIANKLDAQGLIEESGSITNVMKKLAQSDDFEDNSDFMHYPKPDFPTDWNNDENDEEDSQPAVIVSINEDEDSEHNYIVAYPGALGNHYLAQWNAKSPLFRGEEVEFDPETQMINDKHSISREQVNFNRQLLNSKFKQF